MASVTNSDLQIPHEIGAYIKDQFSIELSTFNEGPDPEILQMKQGMFLQINTYTGQPVALLTRYGMWSFGFVTHSAATDRIENIFKELKEIL